MRISVLPLGDIRRQPTGQQPDFHGDFQQLFREARELRGLVPTIADGEIAAMSWNDLQSWFHRSIADEVFQKKLFTHGVLASIWYVAELLVTFARGKTQSIEIAGHVSRYAASGEPAAVLHAADAAFLMFVFWPEARIHRSVRYRDLASTYGPSLYATYGAITRQPMGYRMAEAFEPLGDIARQRFARI